MLVITDSAKKKIREYFPRDSYDEIINLIEDQTIEEGLIVNDLLDESITRELKNQVYNFTSKLSGNFQAEFHKLISKDVLDEASKMSNRLKDYIL